jgi:HEPN domain-containing protein
VNSEFERKKFFFYDIKQNGVLLYDSKEFNLYEAPKLDIKERIKIAQQNYYNHLDKAKIFFKHSSRGFIENEFGTAAFHLHQASEFLFNCTLLVFNGYEVKLHDLRKLNQFCAASSDKFLDIFPMVTKQEKESFELLQRAYNEGRYNINYQISRNNLEYLISRVEILMQVVTKDLPSFWTKTIN